MIRRPDSDWPPKTRAGKAAWVSFLVAAIVTLLEVVRAFLESAPQIDCAPYSIPGQAVEGDNINVGNTSDDE